MTRADGVSVRDELGDRRSAAPGEPPDALVVVPATDAQREIWLADRLGAESSLAFNQALAVDLAGPLDSDAVARTMQALYERHDALRAVIDAQCEAMAIRSRGSVDFGFFDLSRLSAIERADAYASRRRLAVEEPYDLERGPLFSSELVKLGDDHHLLLLKSHHIVCDGLSLQLLARDAGRIYAVETGQGTPLEPAASFAEFARDTAAFVGSSEEADFRGYWKKIYATLPEPVLLPADRPRQAKRTFAAARVEHHVACGVLARLEQLAISNGLSLFGLCLAALSVLLARLSGSLDVVVGVPAAGQLLRGCAELVGHCVDFIPVRNRIDQDESFLAFARRSWDGFLDALEHQPYTYSRILRDLSVARDITGPPLVNVMFNLVDLSAIAPSWGIGLKVSTEKLPRVAENFDLFVNAVGDRDGLRFDTHFKTDPFDPATVSGWLRSFEALLASIAETPRAACGALDMVSPEDRSRLREWNATTATFDRTARVQDLFGASSLRRGDATALVCGGAGIGYAELESRSNRLSHALRARGVSRGSLVGLCVERGPAMVAAVLGVLKAGGAYVPLDAAFPAERLGYMAQDAKLALLVSESGLQGRIEWPRERTLLLDGDAGEIGGYPETALAEDEHSARPEDPAYVIYTSGSTGKPKGVVVPHRAVVNFLTSMAREPGLGESDRMVAVTTLSFDISVLELLLPLTVGGQVVLASREEAADGHALRRVVETSGATVMQATPSTWRMLIDAGWQGSAGFKGLIGGEALPADLARELLARCGELWNMYGPTETTVWSTCWKVEQPQRGIAIGKPIDNTAVWILDERGQLCPIGVPGEICIGGEGVTLGYLNRAELTAGRFVPDPFGSASGAMLYRTGDRGRWRQDGLLEHLGRLDLQVKVRGYRIELGEIEANLAAHPAVGRCVVITREDRPGDVRLVAYVVPQAGMPERSELREFLRRSLPDYMVPQHFVEMGSIPLLPNGKIDRAGLPAPLAANEGETERFAPGVVELSTQAERLIAGIWSELLGAEAIGPEDNFFSLGGHSMLAMQALARIEKRTGIRIEPRRFVFESLAQLASSLQDVPPATPERRSRKRRFFGWIKRA